MSELKQLGSRLQLFPVVSAREGPRAPQDILILILIVQNILEKGHWYGYTINPRKIVSVLMGKPQ